MAGVWKRDGTIAVTKGSKKVVGTGTTFADPKNAAAKGHLLVMVVGTAVDLYEVDYAESNTVFYLVEAYRGESGTGKAYAIDTSRTDSIPEFARRLNATLGAYQQQSDALQALLTSDAAEITVTAPDGTIHKMIPWKRVTSEGEGQAARAKAEADKATAAAAVAVNVTREVALPLPDVWIPLNDSPNMITGNGSEIKVGGVTVAKMLSTVRLSTACYRDKSRRLRKAAANELRFERWGALIEGAQTNLISNSWNFMNGYGYARCVLEQAVQSPDPDGVQKATTITKNAAGSSYIYLVNTSYPAGKTYTWSIFAKAGTFNKIRLAVQAGVSGQAKPLEIDFNLDDGSWVRSPVSGSFGSAESVKYADGWWRLSVTCEILVSNPANHTFVVNTSPDDNFGSVHIWGFQCEEGAGMSSYIPTNGATATRDADIVSFPRLGNDNYFGPITIAMEVHCNARQVLSAGSESRRGIFSGYPSTGAYEVLMIDTVSSRAAFAYGGSSFAGGAVVSQIEDGNSHVVVAQSDATNNRLYVDGQKAPVEIAAINVVGPDNGVNGQSFWLGAGAGTYGSRQINGHIRNFRMWHMALSDAQCKALR